MSARAIRLVGGPMDGWLVAPDAPVLRPGWRALPPRRTLGDRLRRRPGRPAWHGRYITGKGVAVWRDGPKPDVAPAPSMLRALGLWALLILTILALAEAANGGIALSFSIGQLFLELLADGARLRTSIEEEARKAGDAGAKTLSERLSRGFANVGKTLTDTGKSLTKNLTLPIVGLGAAIFKTGVDFDRTLNQIVGLTDVTRDEIGGVREQILSLSGEIGRTPQELAEAFYFVASAGFEAKGAMDVLETSARAAASGLGQTQDIAKVLGIVLNAYGQENITAARAADILVAAVKDGTAEADAFGRVLGRVIPTAATLGVSFDQVGAALAGMTLTGLDAEESAVSLNQVLVSLLKPTTEAERALGEMGTSSAALRRELREKGLLAVLRDLEKRFDGNDAAAAAVFGNVRALRGVLALLTLDADQLNQVFADTLEAQGDLARAFEETDGPARKLDQAIARVQAALIGLSSDVMPIVADLLETISGAISAVAQGFAALPGPVRSGIVQFAAFVAALGPVLFVTGKVSTGLGKIIGVLGRFGPAIARAANVAAALAPRIAEAIAGLPGAARVQNAIRGAGSRLGGTLGRVIGVAAAAVAVVWFVAELDKRKAEVAEAARGIGDSIGEQIRTGTTEQLEQSQAALRQAIADLTPDEGPFGIRLIGPVQLDALKAVVDEYNRVTTELNRRYEAQNREAALLARDGGQQMVEAFGDGLAGLPTTMEKNAGLLRGAAERWLRRPIGEKLALLGPDGVRAAANLALGVASGIRDKRSQIKSAIGQLREDLKNALKPSKEIGEGVGLLLGKAIRQGLKSADPVVKAQAEGTRALIEARLLELIAAGGKVGKKTLEELERAMKDKNPAVRDQARRTKALIDEALERRTGPKTPGEQIGDDLARDLSSKGPIVGKIAYDIGKTIARNLRAGVQGDRRVPYSTSGDGGSGGTSYFGGKDTGGFAEGSGYVPFDQLAMVHRGEIIVPRAESEAIRAGSAVLGNGPAATGPLIGELNIDASGHSDPREVATAVERAVMDAVAKSLRDERLRYVGSSRP